MSQNLNIFPGRTVRAWISVKTDVRVESSVQPRISVVNHAPTSVILYPRPAYQNRYPHGYPLGYRCYEYQSAKFTMDIRGCTTRTSVILRISARTVQPGFPNRI